MTSTSDSVRSARSIARSLLFGILLVPASASARDRTITREAPASGLRSVRVEATAAVVRIRGVDGSRVRARLDASCEGRDEDASCREYLEGLDLATETARGRLRVELEGLRAHDGRDTELTLTIEVPRRLPVEVDMGAGVLDVTGLSSDLDIDLGAGEVTVRGAEDTVGRVDAHVGIGEASVLHGGRRLESSGPIGGEVHWNGGGGDAEIDVRLGAGQVDVELK